MYIPKEIITFILGFISCLIVGYIMVRNEDKKIMDDIIKKEKEEKHKEKELKKKETEK